MVSLVTCTCFSLLRKDPIIKAAFLSMNLKLLRVNIFRFFILQPFIIYFCQQVCNLSASSSHSIFFSILCELSFLQNRHMFGALKEIGGHGECESVKRLGELGVMRLYVECEEW